MDTSKAVEIFAHWKTELILTLVKSFPLTVRINIHKQYEHYFLR